MKERFLPKLAGIRSGQSKEYCFYRFYCVSLGGKQIAPEHRLFYFLLIGYVIDAALRITFAEFSILGGRVGNLFLYIKPLLLAFLMMRIRNLFLNGVLLLAMVSYYLAYNTILSVQSFEGYGMTSLSRIF